MDEAEFARITTTVVSTMDSLRASVESLAGRMQVQEEFAERLRSGERRGRNNRIAVTIALTGLLLGLWLYHRVDVATRDLKVVQARTSTEILCPLYELFAVSLRVTPAPPAMTPDQVQLRERAGDTIARGLRTLGCAPE